jgi:hypothetical protein
LSPLTLDNTSSGFFVESLNIPLLALRQWGVDIDLKEWEVGLFMEVAGQVTILHSVKDVK